MHLIFIATCYWKVSELARIYIYTLCQIFVAHLKHQAILVMTIRSTVERLHMERQ